VPRGSHPGEKSPRAELQKRNSSDSSGGNESRIFLFLEKEDPGKKGKRGRVTDRFERKGSTPRTITSNVLSLGKNLKVISLRKKSFLSRKLLARMVKKTVRWETPLTVRE